MIKKLATATLFISTGLLAAQSLSTTSVFDLDRKTSTNFYGDVGVSANKLVGDVGEVVGNDFYGDLTLGYKVPSSQSRMKKHFEFKARVNNEKSLMFSLRRAYLETNIWDGTLTMGRFTLPWSKIDENWGLGKLNNRVNFDGFEPDQEGLAGVRYVRKYNSGLKVSAFTSLLYIPELNPSLKIDKGKGTITCQNPWCDAPNSSTEVNGKDTPIFYDVEIPDLTKIVFKYSTALRLEQEVGNWNLSGFLARKPENTISTRVEISSPGGAISSLNAEITPEVYYHNIVGFETTYKINKNIGFHVSSLAIRPDDNPVKNPKAFTQLGIEPKKIDEDYIGGGLDYINRGFKGSINYIARVSEFDKEGDPLVQYPRWNQAFHLNLASKLTRKLSLGLDYKYDTLTEDRLTMFRANYQVSKALLTSMGVNIIGTHPDGESYWAKFTNNDSVYGSLKYSF